MIYPADHPDAAGVLERIALGLDGNFGFVNLVQAVASAALGDGRADPSAGACDQRQGPRCAEQDYARLVERVRSVVREAVPAGASVLVVSKGDEGLLKLDGRKAGHFPQSGKGEYAGHHPADDAAAVAHLDALRAGGRQLPGAAGDVGVVARALRCFRRHLEATAAVTVCRPDTCIVFSLAGRSRHGR